MEAPEKIYLSQERDKEGCYVDLMWHKHPYEDMENIQYVRTDAFINKACEYFRTKKKCVFACIGEEVYHSLLNEEEIKAFKTYMKGE